MFTRRSQRSKHGHLDLGGLGVNLCALCVKTVPSEKSQISLASHVGTAALRGATATSDARHLEGAVIFRLSSSDVWDNVDCAMKSARSSGGKVQADPTDALPANEPDAPRSTLGPEPPAALSIPDHELVRRIGRGSYGEVWLGRNKLGTLRAIKIVHRAAFEDARPFEREFKGIQKFEPISRSHEGLVDILQVGGTEDYFYYVMELADSVSSKQCSVISNQISEAAPASGSASSLNTDLPITDYSPRTLRSDLKRHGRLTVTECVRIGLSLASALAHLHRHRLVHRDVKPSNIIFVGGAPKLADIGLVADLGEARSFVGTEGFIPPEGPGTPQADLYSLGKVLYELSTGKDRHDFPELPDNLRELPDQDNLIELNAVLVKACATDPRQRYQCAEELQADLALWQRGVSVRAKRAAKRLWALTGQVAIITAVIGAFTVAGWIVFHRMGEREGKNPMPGVIGLPIGTRTTNLEAWKLYERAQVCFRQFTIDGEKAARAHLTEAIQLDPNFLLAHNLLFAGYVNSWALPEEEAQAGMRAMARKLLELYPASAEAHYANAYVAAHLDLKFAEAARGFERAVQINPSANALSFYGWYLVYMGKQEAARTQLRRMLDLDPTAPVGESLLGCSYYAERNYAQALDHFQRALELAPGYLYQHLLMGRAHEAAGNYPAALDHFYKMELGRGRPAEELRAKYNALRQEFNESGAMGYWRIRLEVAQRGSNPEDQPYEMASILSQLGRKAEALDWLEKAYVKRDNMTSLLFDHYWDGFRDEARFQVLLKRVGFVR